MKKIIFICIISLLCAVVMAQGRMAAVGSEITAVSVTSTLVSSGDSLTGTASDGEIITVNLNLSEIDDTKLPVQYDYKVIMDAPFVGKDAGYRIHYKGKTIMGSDDKNNDDIYEYTSNNRTPPGTFLIYSAVAVEITNKFIYILDQGNARIQKFDLNGNFLKQIFISNPYKLKKNKVTDNMKPMINKGSLHVAENGSIYLYDSVNRTVEVLNDAGLVSRVVDLKIENDELAKQMKKGFVDLGYSRTISKTAFQKEENNGLAKHTASINAYGKNKNNYRVNIESIKDIFEFVQCQTLNNSALYDKNGNIYVYIYTGNDKDLSGIFVVNNDGRLISKIKTELFRKGKDWVGPCGIFPEEYNENGTIDDNGTIFLVQSVCWKPLSEDCMAKLRIIKLSKVNK